ncbi:hypothetical protein GCM10010317_061950 [Streptomyces mirabilis]|nr:hypothetical protein GCM10010317_061950 [Streptomyces mirabilis]
MSVTRPVGGGRHRRDSPVLPHAHGEAAPDCEAVDGDHRDPRPSRIDALGPGHRSFLSRLANTSPHMKETFSVKYAPKVSYWCYRRLVTIRHLNVAYGRT